MLKTSNRLEDDVSRCNDEACHMRHECMRYTCRGEYSRTGGHIRRYPTLYYDDGSGCMNLLRESEGI